MAGKVYLVGAGPGDPELLTLKGRRALEEASVVVYDRLANPRLLDFAAEGAERIYVGKESRRHAMGQEEINATLVERARAGHVVCRLKGGDPFLFGRGGEEAEALAAASVEWEYIPGITSAIGGPGYAGIPVTHRGLCSTLAVVTAHEDPAKEASALRWEHLARGIDTLVFLMGAERLPTITARLLEHGRSPDTPAALISWASYPEQKTVEGTLENLEERCRRAAATAAPPGEESEREPGLRGLSPAVTVVGEVARLRERLRWFDNRPLFGRRIVITRAREQSEGLARRIEASGAVALCCPTICIRRLPAPDLSGLSDPYDWIAFTSANGVYSLSTALKDAGHDIRRLGLARIAAIGPETARAAEAIGLRVDFVPTRFVAEQVAAEFPEPVQGKRVLIPRAREAREVLPELWRGQGATVDVVPVYETVPDLDGASRLRGYLDAGVVDAITFTASSTVRHFIERVSGADLGGTRIACIGPITAATAREAGLRVDIVADTYTTAGLVDALVQYFTTSGSIGNPE